MSEAMQTREHVDAQIKNYETKLEKYERQLMKLLENPGTEVDDRYITYLFDTIAWCKERINALLPVLLNFYRISFVQMHAATAAMVEPVHCTCVGPNKPIDEDGPKEDYVEESDMEEDFDPVFTANAVKKVVRDHLISKAKSKSTEML